MGLAALDRIRRQVEGRAKDIPNNHLEDCHGTQVRCPHFGIYGKGGGLTGTVGLTVGTPVGVGDGDRRTGEEGPHS